MKHNIQVEPQHYQSLRYDSKERFLSYWNQIEQIVKREPKNVLEVGIGNGFVHKYLRNFGVDVHTFDFDERLGPDTTGSVLEMPFGSSEFDMACCFETLEHLPFENFTVALDELRRVSRRWLLLSLPDVTPFVRSELQVNLGKPLVRFIQDMPNPNPREHHFNGEHYWEIGKRGYEIESIVQILKKHGLKVEENFRVFEWPYHRFLSCRLA